jgi:hypothetical protein
MQVLAAVRSKVAAFRAWATGGLESDVVIVGLMSWVMVMALFQKDPKAMNFIMACVGLGTYVVWVAVIGFRSLNWVRDPHTSPNALWVVILTGINIILVVAVVVIRLDEAYWLCSGVGWAVSAALQIKLVRIVCEAVR